MHASFREYKLAWCNVFKENTNKHIFEASLVKY